eukprot:COSAG06_NODE_51618_length_311_cov_0.518868_1_plen_79_part_00
MSMTELAGLLLLLPMGAGADGVWSGALLQLLWLRLGLPGKKRQPLLSHFILKMITLPRQARDKQKGKLRQEAICAVHG